MSETTNPNIVDVTPATFEREVIERSREVPVVVDFWAPWCGPCRMLGPALEKLAVEYDGKFLLAKANTDEMPDIAAQFRVQGIPAVFALKDAQVRDSFVGVLPEKALRSFIEQLMPTPVETLLVEARATEATNPEAAETLLRDAVTATTNPSDATARIALAGFLRRHRRLDEAHALLADLERRGYLEPDAERLKAELLLEQGAQAAGPVDAARAEADAHPNDLAARFRLAEALAAAGQHREALETALDLVERDRRNTGEEARKLMLALFNVLPLDSDLAAEFRRKLSFVL
jgi:putative thioredoxin